jgi:hypothetical protein
MTAAPTPGQSDRPEHPERPDRPEHPERPENPEERQHPDERKHPERPAQPAVRPARPAGGDAAVALRIVLWVCAAILALGIVHAVGGQVWNLATADDGEGANIAAGLLVIFGGLVGVLGLAGCLVALVGRWLVRRRARAQQRR